MERWVSDVIATMFVLVTVGSFTLVGLWMKLRNDRLKAKEAAGSPDLQRLHEELDALREDTNGQIGELHERLDFAERLLAQHRPDSAPVLPPPPTPLRQRVITPS